MTQHKSEPKLLASLIKSENYTQLLSDCLRMVKRRKEDRRHGILWKIVSELAEEDFMGCIHNEHWQEVHKRLNDHVEIHDEDIAYIDRMINDTASIRHIKPYVQNILKDGKIRRTIHMLDDYSSRLRTATNREEALHLIEVLERDIYATYSDSPVNTQEPRIIKELLQEFREGIHVKK